MRLFRRFNTVQVRESGMNFLFCKVSTHVFDEYTRGLQSNILFVRIGDLQREILAENQTHVDDEKVDGKSQKTRKQRETLGFCRA